MLTNLSKLMLGGVLVCGTVGTLQASEQPVQADAQQGVTVTGTVLDGEGEPIIGASVIVKGTAKGVGTDLDGNFKLTGVKIGDEIQVTYIGCDPYTFKVTGSAPVTITMKENAHSLDEVVVTALGMKREKKALGYSMTELKGEELYQNSVNPVTALQGKVAGVEINQSDGGLFGSNKILIRGASTLGKNNQPIYVVDGIILDNDVNDKEGDWNPDNGDYGNELKNLNPADFESVSVLKGAAATALYGSRALNGVVLITTKSGKGTKGYGVTFNQTLGCDWMISQPDFQNIYGPGTVPGFVDYGRSNQDIYAMATNSDGLRSYKQMNAVGATEGWGGQKFDGQPVEYYDGTIRPYQAYKNNYRDAYRTGFNTTTNLSVTGGNDKTNFYASASYKYAQGIIDNNDFKRFNFLLKASHQISKTVNVEAGVSFANSTPRNAVRNIGEYFIGGTLPRWYDTKDKIYYKGEHGGIANSGYGDKYGDLPGKGLWWSIAENNYTQKETVVRPNAKITITPLDWLRIVGEGSFNYYYTRSESKNPGSGYRNEGGSYSMANSTKEQTNFNLSAFLNKDFQDFEVHAMVRGEYFHSFAQALSMWTNGGLVIPNKYFINNSKEAIGYSGAVSGTRTMWSAMGQIGASWKGQIYLDVTARNDWSSALIYASDKHGTFSYFYPSVSASWLISNTFELPSWISFAKVRGSWAQVGNDTSPYSINTAYVFQSGLNDGKNSFSAQVPNTFISNNLKPERKNSIEFGLDWRFINNRFGIDFAYYKDNTTDQIMDIAVPGESGIGFKKVNAGDIQNQGVELALNFAPIQSKDWDWDFTLTYTKNNSKIKKLHPDVANYIKLSGDPDYGNYRVGSVAKVGGAYGLIMSDSAPAVDDKDLYQDVNGNYTYDPNAEGAQLVAKASGMNVLEFLGGSYRHAYLKRSGQLKELGDINPDFLGSFSTNLRWKNLRLNVALDCRFGGYVASYGSHYGTAYGYSGASLRWRDPEHGGTTWTSKWDNIEYHDGVIPDAMFQAGQRLPIPGQVDDKGNQVYYTVQPSNGRGGETYRELFEKGVIEPQHAGTWQYWNNCWINANTNRGVVTSDWFKKLNYIALREVSLAYTLPTGVASKIGSRGITLSATGHNLGYLLNSMPNKENPEAVRGTNAHEFRIRTFEGTTASFTFTINATF